MGTRPHEIIMESAPSLAPGTWYGMPADELDGRTVCFFRVDGELMTFGFTEHAALAPDEDAAHQLVASAWVLTGMDEATEEELAEIVRAAVE